MTTVNDLYRFDQKLKAAELLPLRARTVQTLQVNLGKLCNQACRHCHVDAGPHRTGPGDNMGEEMVGQLLEIIEHSSIKTLDLTGGAPELHPQFRRIVERARHLDMQIIDRCNLSVLFEPGQETLAGFLAAQRVDVVASLPHPRRQRTDNQRGAGVFDKSIEGLRRLNALGYGDGQSGLILNLVHNPSGAYLPADQEQIEMDYRLELDRQFQIKFDHLFCITNMPIARFQQWLQRSGNEAAYLAGLDEAFNPVAAQNIMCRDLISVSPDGRLHDCDFNQMLGLPVHPDTPSQLADFDQAALASREIVTGEHCLGCTAGSGSSCGGATA